MSWASLRVQDMKDNQLFNKFFIAIQDLIKEEYLLNIMDPQTKTVFQHFKDNIVFDCHYINDFDSPQRKNDKCTILYQQIINMPLSVKNMFNDEYPHLLSGASKPEWFRTPTHHKNLKNFYADLD